jgi:hypothetical protein
MYIVMTAAQEKREEPTGARRPSKHAVIMRGIVAPLLGLFAIASIILGVLNATQWKPSADITARTTVSNARYIITDPGVLQLVDAKAELTVNAASGGADAKRNVCVALGAPKDVAGWTAGHDTVRITGLSDWTTLSQGRFRAQGEPAADDASGVAFPDSDMWSAVRCGDSHVVVRTNAGQAANIALIDLGGDSADATVSLHWVRSTLPNFAMPLYFVGGLLFVLMILAASVFAMPMKKRRKRQIMSRPIETTQEIAIAEALTGSLHGLTAAVRIKPRTGQHRRHAAHRGSATQRGQQANLPDVLADGNERTPQTPTIIDPAARNMVADQQGTQLGIRADAPDDETVPTGSAEQTSIISPDELQTYFARLSQEMALQEGDSPDKAAGDEYDGGSGDAFNSDNVGNSSDTGSQDGTGDSNGIEESPDITNYKPNHKLSRRSEDAGGEADPAPDKGSDEKGERS